MLLFACPVALFFLADIAESYTIHALNHASQMSTNQAATDLIWWVSMRFYDEACPIASMCAEAKETLQEIVMSVAFCALLASMLLDAEDTLLEFVAAALRAKLASMLQDVEGRNQASAPNAKNSRTTITVSVVKALLQELVSKQTLSLTHRAQATLSLIICCLGLFSSFLLALFLSTCVVLAYDGEGDGRWLSRCAKQSSRRRAWLLCGS